MKDEAYWFVRVQLIYHWLQEFESGMEIGWGLPTVMHRWGIILVPGHAYNVWSKCCQVYDEFFFHTIQSVSKGILIHNFVLQYIYYQWFHTFYRCCYCSFHVNILHDTKQIHFGNHHFTLTWPKFNQFFSVLGGFDLIIFKAYNGS